MMTKSGIPAAIPQKGRKMSKVLIIGGGAAGMMAAISAAESGKSVELFEKNEKLGKSSLSREKAAVISRMPPILKIFSLP